MEDEDVVGHFLDEFDVEGVEGAIIVFKSEANLEVNDVDVVGGVGGLEHRRDKGGVGVDLVKFFGTEVVDKDIGRKGHFGWWGGRGACLGGRTLQHC